MRANVDRLFEQWAREIRRGDFLQLGISPETMTYRLMHEGAGVLSRRPMGAKTPELPRDVMMAEAIVTRLPMLWKFIVMHKYYYGDAVKRAVISINLVMGNAPVGDRYQDKIVLRMRAQVRERSAGLAVAMTERRYRYELDKLHIFVDEQLMGSNCESARRVAGCRYG